MGLREDLKQSQYHKNGSSHKPPTFATNRLVCQTFAGYLPSFGAFGLAGALVLKFPIPGA